MIKILQTIFKNKNRWQTTWELKEGCVIIITEKEWIVKLHNWKLQWKQFKKEHKGQIFCSHDYVPVFDKEHPPFSIKQTVQFKKGIKEKEVWLPELQSTLLIAPVYVNECVRCGHIKISAGEAD